jgi:hypothetical protein
MDNLLRYDKKITQRVKSNALGNVAETLLYQRYKRLEQKARPCLFFRGRGTPKVILL